MFLIRLLGIELIREIITDVYHWWKHRRESIDLCSHSYFSFMDHEKKDKLPYHVIENTVKNKKENEVLARQELLQCFFPIKVKVFEDKMRKVCIDYKKNRKLNMNESDIIDWCYLYNGEANKEWEKRGKKNNAMAIFTKKFQELHINNIVNTQNKINHILKKDIKDNQKLDRILDILRWAFKLSLPYVLNASESLNGSLTRELKKP